MNVSILIGRLVKDPELKYTPTGTAVATFTIAVDKPVKDKEADFINIVAWSKLAELVAQYCAKGKQVAIEGRISTRNYSNAEGKKVYVTEVVANNVTFLGTNQKKEQETGGGLLEGATPSQFSPDDLPFE
jgi:single-strand DNA-binding protein